MSMFVGSSFILMLLLLTHHLYWCSVCHYYFIFYTDVMSAILDSSFMLKCYIHFSWFIFCSITLSTPVELSFSMFLSHFSCSILYFVVLYILKKNISIATASTFFYKGIYWCIVVSSFLHSHTSWLHGFFNYNKCHLFSCDNFYIVDLSILFFK